MTSQTKYAYLDVECIATGYGHRDRGAVQVCVIDENQDVLMNDFILQKKIVSFLTPFSGMNAAEYEKKEKKELKKVIEQIEQLCKQGYTIVGFGLDIDFERLGMDAKALDIVDLRIKTRVINPSYGNFWYTPLKKLYYMFFKQSIQVESHDCLEDCLATQQVHKKLLENNFDPNFLRKSLYLKMPQIGNANAKACGFTYEGVCMAGFSPKDCSCSQKSYKD